MNDNRMNLGNDEVKFVPTREQWGVFYKEWYRDLVKSLWKECDPEAAADAVSEAFLKLAGLSERYRLEKPLEAMPKAVWKSFVRKQAEWCLRHRWEKEGAGYGDKEDLLGRIVAAERAAQLSVVEQRKLRRDRQRLFFYDTYEECGVAAMSCPGDEMAASDFKRRVRELVAAVCREHRLREKDYRAFVLYVLEGYSAREVVDMVYGPTEDPLEIARRKDSLFVMKHRVIKWLRKFAASWRAQGGSYQTFVEAA